MKPTKSTPKSSAASGPQGKNSVYDFLYYDAARVGSFLGQFDPDGHLTGIQTSAKRGGSSISKATVSGSGGVPLVATLAGTSEDQAGTAYERGAEKSFDPLWGNALAFLDYLTQQGLIVTNIAGAGMGQIVQISGGLSIIDMSVMQGLLASPVIKKFFAPPTQSGSRHVREQKPDSASLGMAVVEVLPHVIQARMVTKDSFSFWSSLSSEGLTISPSDILLKHGLRVAGQWVMLGILDAFPDESSNNHPIVSDAELGAYVSAMAGLIPIMRPLLGRPIHAYGVTPLLIFREVSGG